MESQSAVLGPILKGVGNTEIWNMKMPKKTFIV